MDDRGSVARWVAILLLFCGIAFLVMSVLIVAQRSAESPQAWPGQSRDAAKAIEQAQLLLRVMVLIGVIFLVFALACLGMSRWSQRFQGTLGRGPREPTPNEDVWQMHRLPEAGPDEEPDEEPDGEPDGEKRA